MALTEYHRNDLVSRPVTVSSTSSMETAASMQNEITGVVGGTQNFSLEPSLVRSPLDHHRQESAGYGSLGIQRSTNTAMSRSIGLVRGQLRSPTTGIVIPSVASPNTVPEFLYQLTKMLTDNNRDIIEWSNGKIEVHNPNKLQTHVLNRYFRHSKFASFQRQLNYFGFRKLAGKGKMAPCSYVNDATTSELRSLLHIKRKTGNEPKAKSAAEKMRIDQGISAARAVQVTGLDPVLAGRLQRSGEESNSQSSTGNQPQHTQQALARVAVGKGIRHSFTIKSNVDVKKAASQSPVQAGLSALTSNFKNSLQGSTAEGSKNQVGSESSTNSHTYVPGSLRRDDSLVDLAMIPMIDGDPIPNDQGASAALTFIDFPWDPSILQNDISP